jgi:hypothetical protein
VANGRKRLKKRVFQALYNFIQVETPSRQSPNVAVAEDGFVQPPVLPQFTSTDGNGMRSVDFGTGTLV